MCVYTYVSKFVCDLHLTIINPKQSLIKLYKNGGRMTRNQWECKFLNVNIGTCTLEESYSLHKAEFKLHEALSSLFEQRRIYNT
jgi:hypothetical protein